MLSCLINEPLIYSILKDVARQHPHIPELNVLVVGMPNVGKSTLLNALRDVGIRGRTFRSIFFFFHPSYIYRNCIYLYV